MRFLFRLALELGCTVKELQERLTNEELLHWKAFFKLEPFGYEIENYRHGLVCSVIANANRGRGQSAFKPKDFMPKENRKQTIDEQKKVFEAINNGIKGTS